MPLLAIRKFRSYISKKVFYTLGFKIASHPYYVLCLSLFLIYLISYSALIDYFTKPYSLSPPLIDAHLWQYSSHIQQHQATDQESFIAKQVRVVSPENTLSKQLLRESLAIYQSLTVSKQLKAICATTQQRQCLIHSPLSLWDYGQQKIDSDLDIIGTINRHKHDTSKTTGLSLHPYTTLGNVTLDSHGSLMSANSVILTFILKNTTDTVKIWDKIWQRSLRTSFKMDIAPCLIQYRLRLPVVSPFKFLFIVACGIGMLSLVKCQLIINPKLIKSTTGLGITILLLSLACYTTTIGIKNMSRTPWWYVTVCATTILEQTVLLTRAVVATCTRDNMTVKERIGKGLQEAGVKMVMSLLSELCILGTGSLIKEDNIRSFCSFAATALIVAFILSLTFFVAVLSIDIRRAELTDLDNCDGFERQRIRNSLTIHGQNVKSKRAINSLLLCIVLFILNMVPASTNPTKQTTPSIEIGKTQWMSISTLFWSALNPSYKTQSLQVHAPYIVVATLNKDFVQDNSKLIQDLTAYYADKFTLLHQYLKVRSTQYSWLDSLHPYHLITYLNHYRNVLPSIILLLVWIGIMLWMNAYVREQYMLPVFRVVFVRTVTFFLRTITCLTMIQTDSLIRKVETEYNEDGMHLGAISLQSQFHLQYTRDRVPNVRVRTLIGQHVVDIQDIACGGDAQTQKLVSTDQEGKVVLWNITEEAEAVIARLDQQRRLDDGLNGWMGTKLQPGQSPAEMRQLPPAQCIQMDSQGKLVAAGYEYGYICVWNADTAIVVIELSVQYELCDCYSNRVIHLSFLESKETTTSKYNNHSNKCIVSVHKNGYLREWNIETGEMMEAFDSKHKRDISAIHVLEDNQRAHKFWIFTASKDGILKCWERTLIEGPEVQQHTSKWRCLYSIQAHHGHLITSLNAHQMHNGMGILVTGSSDGGVRVWHLTSGNSLCTLSNDGANDKMTADKKDGLLLQFSRVAQQQDNHHLPQPQNSTQDFTQADHGGCVNQVVVTRLGCPEFDNDKCANCQTTLNTGFLVASCASDDSVHCWRLDRKLMNDVGCTQCIKEYRHQPYPNLAPIPSSSSAGPPRASQRKKQGNTYRGQFGNDSEEDTELLLVSISFLGRFDQVDSHGLVFCDNMVLAGVRRQKIRLDADDNAGPWEAWFVCLQYYAPPPNNEEAIPIITFDLEKDEDYYREIEEEELLHQKELAKNNSNNSLWDHILLNLFGIKKVRTSTWPMEAALKTRKKNNRKREPSFNTSNDDQDEDAYEILPFPTLRLVISMNGLGFFCDYGNFIKFVSFDNPNEVISSTCSI